MVKALRTALQTFITAANEAETVPPFKLVKKYHGELLPERIKINRSLKFPACLIYFPEGVVTVTDAARTDRDGSHRVQLVVLTPAEPNQELTSDAIDDLEEWLVARMLAKKFITDGSKAYQFGTEIHYSTIYAGMNDNQVIIAGLLEFELKTPNWRNP